MSKIICDVCGTTYPETAAQCPICGCVRPGEAKVVSTNTSVLPEEGENSYTYVKGGRFSKSNVRKRNQNNNAAASASSATAKEDGEKKDGSEKGLTIAVIVLLLAIVAVVLYVVLRVFGHTSGPVPAELRHSVLLQTPQDSLFTFIQGIQADKHKGLRISSHTLEHIA